MSSKVTTKQFIRIYRLSFSLLTWGYLGETCEVQHQKQITGDSSTTCGTYLASGVDIALANTWYAAHPLNSCFSIQMRSTVTHLVRRYLTNAGPVSIPVWILWKFSTWSQLTRWRTCLQLEWRKFLGLFSTMEVLTNEQDVCDGYHSYDIDNINTFPAYRTL